MANEEGRGDGERGGERRRGGTSPWEWAIAAVGALLVLGVVAAMLHEALGRPSTPPRVELTVDTVIATGSGHLVEFRARNRGSRTAAMLVVEGELRGDTGTVETAQTTLDYLPEGSERSAGLFFTHDPARYRLELRPKGYDHP